ncbi:pyridoxamine 5'-phosphate oxidase family protein [Novosphingobium sp. TH158]|uniref:pyridoxamine 5'-phosphate oxidase family protein n=1 Tax=Novosphingobium sp. TH158 TaxID=2067455 RepID=UPI000C7CAFFB|nr:pyridoxamine 5'-phosphate oxidase family protein [Novosphingobium sp. TH158]PLK25953.1 hypothetical protein C0V78_02895 [Novosphingobium sp. TH158]
MHDQPGENSGPVNSGRDLQGEGNYDAARRFDAEQEAFASDEERVDRAARQAAEALDGPEGEELRKAERDTGRHGQYTGRNNAPDVHEIRRQFWHAIEASPFVMLQLSVDPSGVAPMTAQLDRDGNHNIWFFTTRSGRFAEAGPATAIFVSRDHDVFARFEGELIEETDPARIDKHWSNTVEAWYEHGKQDPDLLMLRMALGEASIWSTDELGLVGAVKLMLGMDMRDEAGKGHVETRL